MRIASYAALVALVGCADASGVEPGTLVVTPDAVTCAAGSRVPLQVSGAAGAPVDFALGSDAVRLADVDRASGSASVVCRAAGVSTIAVSAAATHVVVPVTVSSAPAGSFRVTSTPSALALINGTTSWVTASIASTIADASTEVRYTTDDSTIVVVDSISGQVRATGAGSATIVARSRAEPAAIAATSVTVTPGSSLVAGLALSNQTIVVMVGDSAQIRSTVFLTRTAPPTTSVASSYTVVDPRVATVSREGVVRALRAGGTTIVVASVAAPLIRASLPIFVLEPSP